MDEEALKEIVKEIKSYTPEQREWIRSLNKVSDVVLNHLQSLRDGREDVVIMSDEAAQEIFEVLGVENPFDKTKEK